MVDLYVSDTILYIQTKPDVCRYHSKTKEQPRLTDGQKHPVVIKKLTPEELKKLQDKETGEKD